MTNRARPRYRAFAPELGFCGLVVALVTLGQIHAVHSEFLDDDYFHLYEIVTWRFPTFIFSNWGMHALALFRAALAMLHFLFGGNAAAYSVAGLVLHLTNCALLYAVMRRKMDRWIAAAATCLWGANPVLFDTVQWVSAIFGQGLVTACLLVSTLVILRYYDRRSEPPWWSMSLCVLLMFLGALAYSVGTATAFAFPIAAWLLAPKESNPKRVAYWLSPLFLTPLLNLLLVASDPTPPGPVPYGLILRGAALLFGRLVGYGVSALVMGPVFAVNPMNTAGWPFWEVPFLELLVPAYFLATIVLAGALWSSRSAGRTNRRALLAFALLVVVPYGLVAMGRAPWPDAFTVSRYHYTSLAAAALALGTFVSAVMSRASLRWRRTAARLFMAYAAVLSVLTFLLEPTLRGPLAVRERAAAKDARSRLEAAIDRAPDGSTVYLENEDFGGTLLLMKMGGKLTEFPRIAGYFVILHDANTVRGRKVRFVEHDLGLVHELQVGPSERMRELVVSEVPVP